MSRQIKTSSVAFAALLVFAALAASGASAASYTASSYPTTATGESSVGNDVLTTEAGKVECNLHFEGTLSEASSSVTLGGKYSNCKAFGFLEASFSPGSCDGSLQTPTGSADSYSATMKISCGATPIKITASTCQLTIGAQTTGGSVAITNETASKDVKAKANLTGIAYTVTQDGIGCPFAGTGAKTGATYTQGSAVTASSTFGSTIDVG